jgi:Flp pilus assembly protein TadB
MRDKVQPQTRGDVRQRRSGGLRPMRMLGVVAVAVVGALIAFWVLSSIVGIIWLVVKVVVFVAVVGGLAWLFLGRRHRK